MVYFSGLRYL